MTITQKTTKKEQLRTRRRIKIRAKVSGTATRPRLAVFRSLKHISAQLIDDTASKTIVAANENEIKDIKGKKKVEIAEAIGELLAKKAIEAKINSAVFDRSGYKYHGRVKALATSARKAGLEF